MPQTDAGQVRSPARVQRIRRLKRLIIMVPLSTILILMILCIFLGIRLHMVKKELREAQAVIDRVSDGCRGGRHTIRRRGIRRRGRAVHCFRGGYVYGKSGNSRRYGQG